MNNRKLELAFYLSIRILLMILLQGVTFLLIFNMEHGFEVSGYYWATQLTIVNLLLLGMMVVWFQKRNEHYFTFFKFFSKKNTVLFLKLFLPLVIAAMLPNLLLSWLLYRDLEIGTKILLQDIHPFFIVINLTFFPILQGIVELPFYFMFIMPMLKKLTHHKWIYIGLPVFFLSIQHAFMPLRFEFTYIVYRSVMFFPFALFIGLLLHRRPTLLPYLVILHILMNASFAMMILFP